MAIRKTLFGQIAEQGVTRDVYAYTMTNRNGMSVTALDFGCALHQVCVPDRNGVMADVIGGFDAIDSYCKAGGYQGAVVGRFGNRIAKGKFSLGGKDYTLAQNNGVNHLHGGNCGFSHRIWDVTQKDGDEPELIFHRVSADGEEGYPGNLDVTVTYRLTAQNGLVLRYQAHTDAATVVNLTNHSYFNLGGFNTGSVHSHVLTLDADAYLPTDSTLIPTGELRSVDGTPFDFRVEKPIGQDIGAADADLVCAGGYDHCMVFADRGEKKIQKRGELYDPESGRLMELYTNQPCVQLYSANFLNEKEFPLKGGYPQTIQTFVCLETECMPDSINHAGFTNTVLQPGEVYDYTTEYRFLTK